MALKHPRLMHTSLHVVDVHCQARSAAHEYPAKAMAERPLIGWVGKRLVGL